jgi:NADH-quinone oxidoreductase subunit J
MNTSILFLILSIISIVSALGVIFARNPVYSVLMLIVVFFSIAGHLILLRAEFLAIVNIVVYAGAIMVLFLFVIMMLNLNLAVETPTKLLSKIAAVIAAGLLLITLLGAVKGTEVPGPFLSAQAAEIGTVKNLGKVLFGEFLLPFELSSVLFLSAMIGAVMLGKKNLNEN